ncbi:MAG: discoidin domain-containing protein [Xanthomonadales bacterium]|nr:discoidin domain-containing protein [Xanthomonadales bacterium]
MHTRIHRLAATLALCAAPTFAAAATLDDFRDASAWKAAASDQVTAALHAAGTKPTDGLCLAYDFNGVSGHAAMRRTLPITFPADYAFDFDVRGSGPANQFEFKLIDASGDNVWWVSKPKTVFADEWTPVRYKKRHIRPAWGPLADKTLRQTQSVEFTIYANEGGRGEACIRNLRFGEREPQPTSWPEPTLRADAGRVPAGLFAPAVQSWPEAPPAHGERPAWRSAKPASGTRNLVVDFGRAREFGAIALRWVRGEPASRYDVDYSDDGRTWRTVRRVTNGNGGIDHLLLTESETRFLRLVLRNGPASHYALEAIDIRDLEVGASANAFLQRIASESAFGLFPRGFSGQQTYWTVVGIDGGHESGLLGEDGALEVARGGFSITPFVIDGTRLHDPGNSPSACGRDVRLGSLTTWAYLDIEHALDQGDLPMPSVTWKVAESNPVRWGCPQVSSTYHRSERHPWHLAIDAFAQGEPGNSRLFGVYTLSNDSDEKRTLTLALAIQPFQVNPPVQFLTTPGGVSPIDELGFDGRVVSVNGTPRVRAHQPPSAFFATPFDNDMVAQHLAYSEWPTAQYVRDATGLASGALVYRIELGPRESRTITLDIPLEGQPRTPKLPAEAMATWVGVQQRAVSDAWRAKLDRVAIRVPAAGQPIVDTLHTALAHVLVNRDGAKIRPGTRSYARSWIRDGAMTSEALLRMGHVDEARAFLEWFAPFQFADGKVPCCVDARGSDPVPENDSHGELVFLAAEVARYTQDRALAEAMWPHVDRATRYLDRLRDSERSEANRGTPKYGLLPPSISHEGYSAKPAYSHWDNFWGLIGYKSAITLADQLDRADDAKRLAASRDTFRADILASLDASAQQFGIGFIPGAADLGDFDATSTTIALSPGGEREHLPAAMLEATFERYWREFVQRRDGQREWKDYTPYEWRNVSAFIRLGWRARAHEAIDYFFRDRRPAEWNQWAEVVGREVRESRFIGDMPHGWVASDFIRAALDLFAYEREADGALVLGAGIPSAWLDGDGVSIDGLNTPYGVLGYTLKRDGDSILFDLRADPKRVPPGAYVLSLADDLTPGRTRIDGRKAAWTGHELRIDKARAKVRVALAKP